MLLVKEPTCQVRIYMAGPIEVAKPLLRELCTEVGDCVTVEPTTFIYSYGEEQGFVVGFLNYPRFPRTDGQIIERARTWLHALLDCCCQGSALLVTPAVTEWVTRRPQDQPPQNTCAGLLTGKP